MIHLALWLVSAAIVLFAGWLALMPLATAIGTMVQEVREAPRLKLSRRRFYSWVAIFVMALVGSLLVDDSHVLPGIITLGTYFGLIGYLVFRSAREWYERRDGTLTLKPRAQQAPYSGHRCGPATDDVPLDDEDEEPARPTAYCRSASPGVAGR